MVPQERRGEGSLERAWIWVQAWERVNCGPRSAPFTLVPVFQNSWAGAPLMPMSRSASPAYTHSPCAYDHTHACHRTRARHHAHACSSPLPSRSPTANLKALFACTPAPPALGIGMNLMPAAPAAPGGRARASATAAGPSAGWIAPPARSGSRTQPGVALQFGFRRLCAAAGAGPAGMAARAKNTQPASVEVEQSEGANAVRLPGWLSFCAG